MVLLFVLFSIASSLVFEAPASLAGAEYPHHVHLSQNSIFDNRPNFWNRTYDVAFLFQSACLPLSLTAAEVSGKILVFASSERDFGCTMSDVVNKFNPLNPVAYLVSDFFGFGPWGSFNQYAMPSNDVPVFYTGNQAPYSATYGDFGTNLAAVIFTDPNNTRIRLTHPTMSPFFRTLFFPRTSDGAVRWINYTVCLILVLVATFKYSQIYSAEGAVKASIPQMVIGLSFVVGVISLVNYGMLGGIANSSAIAPIDGFQFTFLFAIATYYAALMVLGFYFGEVASITSAKNVPGLGRLRLPAVIFILVNYIFFIVFGAIDASDFLADDSVNLVGYRNLAFAWIGVVCPFIVSCILVWGSISLLQGFYSMGKISWPAVRIFLIALLCILTMWTLLFMVNIYAYGPGTTLNTVVFETVVQDYFWQRDLMTVFGTCFPCILICLNFSVSVSKEIEISKSGTSSTSGSSGSAVSSSSSSSSDPVIEL